MENKAMKRKPRGYWNEENVRLEANSYINQTAFRLKADEIGLLELIHKRWSTLKNLVCFTPKKN